MSFPPQPLTRFAGLLASLVLFATTSSARVSLAPVFGDHMVLQAGLPVAIWGQATPGEAITVTFDDASTQTAATADGTWLTHLPTLEASPDRAPGRLIVEGKNRIVLSDILVGEVWLCSGQSNMRYRLGRPLANDPANPVPFAAEVARADAPAIRLLNVSGGTPADRTWAAVAPATVESFSALAYFFGRQLHTSLGVPIGLIDLGKGGAPLRAFLPPDALDTLPGFAATVPAGDKTFASVYTRDFAWFAPFTVRGLLWYQGESDVTRAATYASFAAAMLDRWRHDLRAPALPVLLVQLPVFERTMKTPPSSKIGTHWAELRAAQQQLADADPHTWLVPALDLGERLEIHPSRKPELALRLAAAALRHLYDRDITADAPTLTRSSRHGDQLTLTFAPADGGLVASAAALADFTLTLPDGTSVPVTAAIEGTDRVVVTLPPGTTAGSVRYGWRDYFVPSLFSGHGLPALPFAIDLASVSEKQ